MFFFFLGIGFGADTGWGVSGDLLKKLLEEMSVLLDNSLQLFVAGRHSTKKRIADDAASVLAAKKIMKEKRQNAHSKHGHHHHHHHKHPDEGQDGSSSEEDKSGKMLKK